MSAFNWLTTNSRKFLDSGYMSEMETPEQRLWVAASRAEELTGFEGLAKKLYEYMSYGWVSPSSPIWANFGKKRGLPVSCFNSHVPDSIGGILFAQSEVGVMSKMGGGTSGYFGDVRPRGSDISDSGKTSGSVHFMELFEKVADVVSQSNVRRGRFAPYLPIDHGDIEEFLEIGTEGHPIQNLTTGVTVTKQWLKEMREGDRDKRRIWAKVLKSRSEVGYPYIMNVTNANDQAPDVYKDKGYWINASNLCLKGDSIIEVLFPFYEEYKEIDIETFVKLWNIGCIPPNTKVKTENGASEVTNAAQTGSTKKMIRITDNNTGKVVECTPDHQIYTTNRGWVQAKDLNETDDLLLD